MDYFLFLNLDIDESEVIRGCLEPKQEVLTARDIREAGYYLLSFKKRIIMAVVGCGDAADPQSPYNASILIEALHKIEPRLKIFLVSMDKTLLETVAAQSRSHIREAVCLSVLENFDEAKTASLIRQAALPEPSELTALTNRSPIVFFIDDEDNLRKVMAITLRNDGGLEVLEADSVSQASGIFLEYKHRINCTVVDYNLKDGEAYLLIKGMKTSEPAMPVILITGEGDYADKKWYQEIKDLIAAVLPKPFTGDDLLALVNQTIRQNIDERKARRRPILVIDDAAETVRFINAIVSDREIVSTENGADGLKKFKEIKPSAVFLDYRLPDTDGLEVLKKIKEIDPAARVVAVTIIKDRDVSDGFLKLGAVRVLLKPFNYTELKKTLKELAAGEEGEEESGQ